MRGGVQTPFHVNVKVTTCPGKTGVGIVKFEGDIQVPVTGVPPSIV